MNKKPRNLVGGQVRKLRCAMGLSQPAFAACCQRIGWDVGRDVIAKIEGLTRWVSDSELILLAEALRVNLMSLYPQDAKKRALLVLAQNPEKTKDNGMPANENCCQSKDRP